MSDEDSRFDEVVTRYTAIIENEKHAKAYKAGDIVPHVGAMTKEWLQDVLCADMPECEVDEFRIEPVSSGTHARHRIFLTYNEAARRQGLPVTLFTKSLPSVEHRMIAGQTKHARTESGFYNHLRPELGALEIPRCYHSIVCNETSAALHMLEDLVATKGADFCDFRTYVGRSEAEDMVALLATMHGHFYDDDRFNAELGWITPYDRWYLGGVKKFQMERFTAMAFQKAAEVVPDRLLARSDEVVPATLRSLEAHRSEKNTLLHSDVHIGNWYRTAAGRMGLADWQCAARGHWSRDLAYVISAALTIEDRRAWERDLIRSYLEQLQSSYGQRIDENNAWNFYRQQLPHALQMWTLTLCHADYVPDMQPEAVSLAMVERMSAAIDDLDALDA